MQKNISQHTSKMCAENLIQLITKIFKVWNKIIVNLVKNYQA